jgi:hypothetical protein
LLLGFRCRTRLTALRANASLSRRPCPPPTIGKNPGMSASCGEGHIKFALKRELRHLASSPARFRLDSGPIPFRSRTGLNDLNGAGIDSPPAAGVAYRYA